MQIDYPARSAGSSSLLANEKPDFSIKFTFFIVFEASPATSNHGRNTVHSVYNKLSLAIVSDRFVGKNASRFAV